MVGQSNYDRSYLMALKAWKTFGHTSEDPRAFARRMAKIGETQGISAAANAISEDCNAHGLEMSQGRVLKSLEGALSQYRSQFPKLNSIEDIKIEEIGALPPGVASLFSAPSPSSPQRSGGGFIKFMIGAVILAAIGWLIFR